MTTTTFDYGVFDADNHYYEATDAYTRYIDPAFAKRTMQWAEIDGKRRLLVGGKVNRFIPNPLFDPVAKPGSLNEVLPRSQSRVKRHSGPVRGDLEPIRPEYRDRDARLRVMDEQGLDGCLLFPTLGVGMEESLADDPPALVAAFSAFNRWLEDDWGYAYKERIFAAPMLTLIDLDAAVIELQRVLDNDARIICIKAGPAHSGNELTSPADKRFDPFWGLVNEAGVTVGIHSVMMPDTGVTWRTGSHRETSRLSGVRRCALMLDTDRVPLETMAALVCHGLFDRFPRIRVASIESGASWVPVLMKKLKKAYMQMPGGFASDPVQTVRDHIWVAPFYEDDLQRLKEYLGLDHVLFGSDWPHAEGLTEPRTFAEDLARHGYDEAEIRTVMAENARPLVQRLLRPKPANADQADTTSVRLGQRCHQRQRILEHGVAVDDRRRGDGDAHHHHLEPGINRVEDQVGDGDVERDARHDQGADAGVAQRLVQRRSVERTEPVIAGDDEVLRRRVPQEAKPGRADPELRRVSIPARRAAANKRALWFAPKAPGMLSAVQ